MPRKVRSKNFEFVRLQHQQIYSFIFKSEKNLYINHEECRNNLRKALEGFDDYYITKNKLRSDYLKFLGKNRDSLNNMNEFLKKDSFFSNYYEDAEYIRKKTNPGSHYDTKDKSTFTQAVRLFEKIHRILRDYYLSINNIDIPEFDENLLAIDKYFIQSSYIPEDSKETLCQREYKGYCLNENDEIEYYTIIRQYPTKVGLDSAYLEREYRVHFEISKRYIPISKHIPNIEIIQRDGKDGANYNFVMVAYNFASEPLEINDELLKEISFEERLEICKKIIEYFSFLHKNNIYHRLFNYKCIRLCNYDDNYIPYIIKLNFAKIANSRLQTVVKYASNARNDKKNKEEKYISSEWNSLTDNEDNIWEKVDIYALGIFMIDILSGKIWEEKLNKEKMKEFIPENLIEIITKMTSNNIRLRPSCNEILEVLKNA